MLENYSDLIVPIYLPAYAELPDIDLYVDQVVSLMEKYLGQGLSDGKVLTQAMVNNYVKMKAIPAPIKKRYTRTHLVYLIVICSLKPVLPIAAIHAVVSSEIESLGEAAFYERFRESFMRISAQACARSAELAQAAQTSAPEQIKSVILYSAVCARAEQAISESLLAAIAAEKQESVPEKSQKSAKNEK